MASIIKADNIQKVSDGTNIIKKCGSTITLGSCGATISLACGATQTGFGQTYSAVEYCTTAKTSPFTAAAGTGYFINTTCGAVTVTLPASPTAGDVVAFKDYASQWNTNAVTLCNNGNKINGVCATASLSTQNQSVSLIYVDATKGWQDIQDSTSNVTGNAYITATGGTITCCGNYKIHTFTSDGTFTICSAPTPTNNNVDYLVVAGGGSGGLLRGGGAGAGGFRESYNPCTSGCYSASPLATPTSLPVSVTSYPITVGGGGSGGDPCGVPAGSARGTPGSNSIFSTITSTGGGGGGGYSNPPTNWTGRDGGSGGGGGSSNGSCTATVAGSGNTPPVSPPQGNPGGINPNLDYGAGGGGGASAVGGNAPGTSTPGQVAGVGGAGVSSSITGSSVTRAGGGGGGGYTQWNYGGTGGGGEGGTQTPAKASTGGTANTGGGGGGAGNLPCIGGSVNGGSGIVIIRYKYQ
jgi:hypothetical protein